MSRRRKSKSPAKPRRRILPRLNFSFAWLKSIDWHIIRRSSVGLSWLIFIAVVIVAWTLGVPRLKAFASQRGSVDRSKVLIRFVDQPQWVKGPMADHLLRTAAMQVEGDPMQRDDLVAIREALLSTGWLDSVDQVRRVQPDLIEISAKFVRPYTLVRDSAGYHLIDIRSKLLPKSYKPGEDLPVMVDPQTGHTVPMIAISGVHFDRPGVGKVWEGGDIVAGLKLLQLIDQQPWRQQVAEIDVSQFLNDGPIKLLTDKGSTILWGGPPGEETALELLAEGKIQRLNLLYQNHGRIDGGFGGELDITSEKVAVAR